MLHYYYTNRKKKIKALEKSFENCSDALLGCGNLDLRPCGGIYRKCDGHLEVNEKFSLETGVMESGVKGMLPLGCLPSGGERGAPHSLFKM